jgi:hypothetical protein
MRMPGIGVAADFFVTGMAFFVAALAVVGAFFLAGAFFSADFFFSGIGIVMPGIFICATAGAETVPSASALAAANSIAFTRVSPLKKEATR